MQRRPTSMTYLTTLYVHHIRGHHTFTGREIIDNYRNCHEYLDAKLPKTIWDERAALLIKHGYPRDDDEWQQQCAIRFAHYYEITVHTMPDLMREVRELFKPFTLIAHESIPVLDNYAYSLINNMRKRGHLELIPDTKPREYHINPFYVDHPLFTQGAM